MLAAESTESVYRENDLVFTTGLNCDFTSPVHGKDSKLFYWKSYDNFFQSRGHVFNSFHLCNVRHIYAFSQHALNIITLLVLHFARYFHRNCFILFSPQPCETDRKASLGSSVTDEEDETQEGTCMVCPWLHGWQEVEADQEPRPSPRFHVQSWCQRFSKTSW